MNWISKRVFQVADKFHYNLQAVTRRTCSTEPKSPPKSPSKSPSKSPKHQTSAAPKEVPGLSKRIVDIPSSEVGPGASKSATYKNPEYFCYHNASYFEAEVEMLKYRLPQPSNKQASN